MAVAIAAAAALTPQAFLFLVALLAALMAIAEAAPRHPDADRISDLIFPSSYEHTYEVPKHILSRSYDASRRVSRDSAVPSTRMDTDFVFPDSQFKPRLRGNKPACANDTTFCETIDGYPVKHLSSVLDNSINYKEYFNTDFQDMVGDRIIPETTLCSSDEKIVYPKVGQNAQKQWMFIVNMDADKKQGIRVELCRQPDTPCEMASNFPEGVTATCRQKYIYRKLLAVAENGDPAPDSFRIPSCCACFIDRSAIQNRMMLRQPTTPKKR